MPIYDSLVQKVVRVGNELGARLSYPTKLIGTVYQHPDINPGEAGQEVSVYVPGPAVYADRKNSPLSISPLSGSNITVVLQQQPAYAFKISDWEKLMAMPNGQFGSAHVQPALIGAAEYLNAKIADLFQAGAGFFNTYTPVANDTAKFLKAAQLRSARANLANAKVPVDDISNMFVATGSTTYTNMTGDSDFAQESMVGVDATVSARQRAVILPQLNAQIVEDPQMPIRNVSDTDVHISAYYHRMATCLVFADLPGPQTSSGPETSYINFRGIPIRVQQTYDINRGGEVIAFDFCYGVKVARPELGQLIYSNVS